MAFRINFGKEIEVRKLEDLTSTSQFHVAEQNVNTIIGELVTITEHIGLIKGLENLDFEEKAYLSYGNWPKWLSGALELNYLGVMSHDKIPSFIVRYSALEVIIFGLLGDPVSILSQSIKKKDKHLLLEGLRSILRKFDITNKGIDRLLNRVSSTYDIGTVTRFKEGLEKLGMKVDENDIRLVIHERGALVHSGQNSSIERFDKAYSLLLDWLQTALHTLLSRNI